MTAKQLQAAYEHRWTPVRRGLTYCSPACGSGCTIVQHDRAVLGGNALVDALGNGWERRVWENMGWFWSAKHTSGMEVHVRRDPRDRSRVVGYWADLKSLFNQFIGEGDTPREAVDALIVKVVEARALLDSIIEATP